MGDTQCKTEEQQSLPSVLILARKVTKGTKHPSQGADSKSSPGSWLRVLRSVYRAKAAGVPSLRCSTEQGAWVRPGGAPAGLGHPARIHFMPHVSTTSLCSTNKSRQHLSEEEPQLLQAHFTLEWLAVPRWQIKCRKSDNGLAGRRTVFPPLIWR